MSRIDTSLDRACRRLASLSFIGALFIAGTACDPEEGLAELAEDTPSVESSAGQTTRGPSVPADLPAEEPALVEPMAMRPEHERAARAQGSEQAAPGASLAAPTTEAVSALQSADLVFDYFEYDQDHNFPPHVTSATNNGYTGYSRHYPNGNILLKQDTYLYRKANGSWTKSSFQAWHDWIRSNMIDSSATVWGVPFQSQLSANCSPNYLCGYAATNMLTAFLHGVTPTTKYMQNMALKAKGSSCPKTLSNANNYLYAAETVGNAPDSYIGFLGYDTIKMLVSEGVPVHVGLTYSELGTYRCDTSWAGGHVVVVVGYSQTNGTWKIHDPLCKTFQTGAYRDIPSSRFRAAVTSAAFGDDTGTWAVVVR